MNSVFKWFKALVDRKLGDGEKIPFGLMFGVVKSDWHWHFQDNSKILNKRIN